MATHKARVKCGLPALPGATNRSLLGCKVGGQQPPVAFGLLQELPVGRRVAPVGVLDLHGAAHAPEEVVDGLGGEPTVAHLVAPVELAVSLLQDGAPHFLGIFRVGVHQLPMSVHGHQVVYNDVGPLPIQAKTDAVHTSFDVMLDEQLAYRLWVFARHGTHGAKQKASAYLSLDDVTRSNAILEEDGVLNDLRQTLVPSWLANCTIVSRLILVNIQHRFWIGLQVPVGIRKLAALCLALLNDLVDCCCTNLAASILASNCVDQRW
mmetsp:Transcript_62583/g.167129  ORF Transcript_62583/g.167129 Transcript_62583/m.167129 type:complete len:265 (+) Transcript_62583:964-1758(+)